MSYQLPWAERGECQTALNNQLFQLNHTIVEPNDSGGPLDYHRSLPDGEHKLAG